MADCLPACFHKLNTLCAKIKVILFIVMNQSDENVYHLHELYQIISLYMDVEYVDFQQEIKRLVYSSNLDQFRQKPNYYRVIRASITTYLNDLSSQDKGAYQNALCKRS